METKEKEINKFKKLLIAHYILFGIALVISIANIVILLDDDELGSGLSLFSSLCLALSSALGIWDIRRRLNKQD